MDNNNSHPDSRPAVTADCVIFGFDGKNINIALIERSQDPFKGYWALPGGFMRMDETIEQCARRVLNEETGARVLYMEQLHVFSDLKRDPRERVLTVAFYALVSKNDYQLVGGDDTGAAAWFQWDELPPLAFDHQSIVKIAKDRLRERFRAVPLAFKLLGKTFKMSELQRLYELINRTTYDRRNFHRKVLSTGLLSDEGINSVPEPNRAAQLYSFNESRYMSELEQDEIKKPPFNL